MKYEKIDIIELANEALRLAENLSIASLSPTSSLATFKRRLILSRFLLSTPLKTKRSLDRFEEARFKLLSATTTFNPESIASEKNLLIELNKYTKQNQLGQFDSLYYKTSDLAKLLYAIKKEEDYSVRQINAILSGGLMPFSSNNDRLNIHLKYIQNAEEAKLTLKESLLN